MASQGFTDDLKHVMRGSAAAARERIAALQRTLRSALGRLRGHMRKKMSQAPSERGPAKRMAQRVEK